MKRVVEITAHRDSVERQSLEWNGAPGELEFRLGEDSHLQTASLMEVEPGIYSVLVGTRSYEAKIVPAGDSWAVDVDGRRIGVRLIDPREAAGSGESAARSGPVRLQAPMPGKVVRILVAEGDAVGPGQGVVVVEAMKMQNEVKAPRAGRIVSLPARVGATVGAGEALAILE